jgi:hypothetical protein
MSYEDLLAEDAAEVAERGYVIEGVRGDHGASVSWVYTAGLLDAAGHPELIVAGPQPEACLLVLRALAEDVMDGARFAVGGRIDVGRGLARVGRVHPVQYRLDTFNMWHALRAAGALTTRKLKAVQIVLPPEVFCACHRDAQPVLSDPHARVDGSLASATRARRP